MSRAACSGLSATTSSSSTRASCAAANNFWNACGARWSGLWGPANSGGGVLERLVLFYETQARQCFPLVGACAAQRRRPLAPRGLGPAAGRGAGFAGSAGEHRGAAAGAQAVRGRGRRRVGRRGALGERTLAARRFQAAPSSLKPCHFQPD